MCVWRFMLHEVEAVTNTQAHSGVFCVLYVWASH